MNYGQVLEVLKNADPAKSVRLRGNWGPFLVDLVMADSSGVYLITNTPLPQGDASAMVTADELLEKLRAIDPQPEFTETVYGQGPNGTGPVDDVSDIDMLFFNAPTGILHPEPADIIMLKNMAAIEVASDEQLAEVFGPGEPLDDATRENAAPPSSAIIQHDFEAVPGFETGGPGGSQPLCVHCDQAADAPVHQIDAAPRHLSPPAAGVLNAMGLGMRLRVPHDGGPAMLHDSTGQGRESLGPVNPEHVQELVATGHLTKLTKDGWKPKADRLPNEGGRMGWDELGLDGDAADFYACVQ